MQSDWHASRVGTLVVTVYDQGMLPSAARHQPFPMWTKLISDGTEGGGG